MRDVGVVWGHTEQRTPGGPAGPEQGTSHSFGTVLGASSTLIHPLPRSPLRHPGSAVIWQPPQGGGR